MNTVAVPMLTLLCSNSVRFLSVQGVQLHAYKQQTWTPFNYTNQMHQVFSLHTFILILSNTSLLGHAAGGAVG
jgi:hypothetical protein